jgi:hypothetical protein
VKCNDRRTGFKLKLTKEENRGELTTEQYTEYVFSNTLFEEIHPSVFLLSGFKQNNNNNNKKIKKIIQLTF